MICVPSGFKKYTYNATSYLAVIVRVVVSVIVNAVLKSSNFVSPSYQPTNAFPATSGAVGVINSSPVLTICVLTICPFASTKLNVVNGFSFSPVIT